MSKEIYEQLQAQNAALEAKSTKLRKEGTYYLNQILRYKAKNPKKTDFPVYEPAK